MRIEEVLAQLDLSDALELIQPHWEETQASLPSSPPAFLDPAEFKANREYAALDPQLDPLLEETARRVRHSPALLRLAWHCLRLLHDHRDYTLFPQWPMSDKALGDLSGLFYLLIALSAFPPMRRRHRERGIPEEITRNCGHHLAESMRLRQMVANGQTGVFPRALSWQRHHIEGELFLLGRMEYMLRPFRGLVQVFRNCETGEVLALAEDGVRFTREGYIDRDCNGEAWESHLVEQGGTVGGCPISPFGMAIRREVQLARRHWVCSLKRGDTVLEMHIPAGGGMTLERCQDSMRRALDFFPRYFPDRPFSGFACTSWILGTHLQEMFPPSANLVRFQKELYLFPHPSSGRDGLYFIFGANEVDPATAPRDTSLCRAFLDYMAAGRRLRGGGMFVLAEDFRHFGSQYYRTHWPPSVLCRR